MKRGIVGVHVLVLMVSLLAAIPIAHASVCGDGIVEPPEECDDGNDVDTDSCRNDCTINMSLSLSDPEYGDCGWVTVTGGVSSGGPIWNIVWDWGDGTTTTSFFAASHRYTANGIYTVTVSAVSCSSISETVEVVVTNAEDPLCMDELPACNYLAPANMHLVEGVTTAVALHAVDHAGAPVAGTMSFNPGDPSLLSIASDGYVTPLRTENPAEIGVWVSATLDGMSLANNSVVRVLPDDYGVPFNELVGEYTALRYPTVIDGEDIEALVLQYEIATVNEYAYAIQADLLGNRPFQGCRQIFEVDFGVNEASRVCGMSGNPIRLGWNIEGNAWQNCFMVPFMDPRSPQWFVFYHEVGHNYIAVSQLYQRFASSFNYNEALATMMGLGSMERILRETLEYPLGTSATDSLQLIYDQGRTRMIQNFQAWVDAGADLGSIDPDVIDGIWMHHAEPEPGRFAERYFQLGHPASLPAVGGVLCDLDTPDEQHTLFAALVSAAADEDLSDVFRDTYNYPIVDSFFDAHYPRLAEGLDEAFACGNGTIEPPEECDDDNILDGDGCDADCFLEVCGNGILQAGEACDDGNNENGDGCDANCELEICGNGIVQADEECDDGNLILGDGCDPGCFLEVCGNGVVQLGEECDDGNIDPGDGCRGDCTVEVCGDGIVDPNEQCDDGSWLDLDAFIANGSDQPNRVWRGDGTGDFLDSAQALGGSFSDGVASGDVDGDGAPDAFVANNLGQADRVWLNDGTGQYTDSGQSLGAAASTDVVLGDLDHDGDLDAFVTDDCGPNLVWLNDGGGSFTDSGLTLGSSCSYGVALGDLDHDGDLDAYVANAGVSDNLVYLNQGGVQGGVAGTFVDSGQRLGPDQDSFQVALGDLDDDGDLDAFVANGFWGGTIVPNTVWRNDGTGQFTDTGQLLGNGSSRGVELGDLDGDADLDAFVVNADGQPNTVWRNDGTGVFSDSGQSLGSASSQAVGLADLDNDGDLDAYVANEWPADHVWLNDGTGSFAASGPGLGDGSSLDVALADLDDDGGPRSGDGCRANCTLEICGDAIVDPGEECDDGNLVPGDGCDASCQTELGCGDGILEPPEECDDNNRANGDGCDSNCILEVCGNGVVQIGEECDDGNTEPADGCDSNCQIEIPATVLLGTPTYDACGAVTIPIEEYSTPGTTFGFIWDWGNGTTTESWPPGTHRYEANGTYTVTVTVVGCTSGTDSLEVQITNAEEPGCPLDPSCNYVYPYNLHLTEGVTSSVPVEIRDHSGNPVSGSVNFSPTDPSLVSVDESGYVTALRTEGPTELGTSILGWVDGEEAASRSVVRVLPDDYGLVFDEIVTENTVLYYPDTVDGEDVHTRVLQNQIADINEYAYGIQAYLMGNRPSSGCRQILEVDFGATPAGTVCGIGAVNPLRFGWNIVDGGSCFMGSQDPQWFVLYHELGHNFTWLTSRNFTQALGTFNYSEGLASILAVASMERILSESMGYPLGSTATASLQRGYDGIVARFQGNLQTWLNQGADFGAVDPDIIDGIWLQHAGASIWEYSTRFFVPLRPEGFPAMGTILCDLNRETLFAAMISAAAGEDLSSTFVDTYHFPIDQDLFESWYPLLSTTIDEVLHCGNGLIEAAEHEECDDGNRTFGDGCDDACKIEPGFDCPTPGASCVSTCGDGLAVGNEECDDGNLDPDDGCDASCLIETGYVCPPSGGPCVADCGDGIVVGDEECDDGNTASGDGCSPTCEIELLVCGNGIVESAIGEECDDGFVNPADGCSPTCQIETGFECPTPGEPCSPICGDSLIVGDEECDDGNGVAGDGCASHCALEPGFDCPAPGTPCSPICGDGLVVGTEECDDGLWWDLDGFVANGADQPNTVWVSDGGGIYTDSGQLLGSSSSSGVALGDLDGDGDQDGFVANNTGQPDRVWWNDGNGTFTLGAQSLIVGSGLSTDVALGDVDGDGDLDAIVTDDGAPNLVWLNQGGVQAGTPGEFVDSGARLGASFSYGVALSDLDGDTDLDIFVANAGISDNLVFLNQGGIQGGVEGTFLDSGQRLGPNADSFDVALDDLDGDGDPDAFVANGFWGGFNIPNDVWLNDGSGNFTLLQSLGNSSSRRAELGDLDGDGDLDAFVTNADGQANTVWLNDGSGSFTDTLQSLGAASSQGVGLRDLDNDGDLDAFVANEWPANHVWLNDGTGTFTDSGLSLGSSSSLAVALGDLDGDSAPRSGDGCDEFCQVELGCGNGILEPPEECDDGNLLDLDGCSSSCLFECLDNDLDGYGVPGTPACPGGSETDCDDSRADVFPGAVELCDNGLDDDCDGATDAEDPDCAQVCNGMELLLVIGWNMVGPARDLGYTASAMCTDIGADGAAPLEVDAFVNGGWVSHICGLPFNDFPILPGEGYFVLMGQPTTWCQEGPSVVSPTEMTLVPGWSAISMPEWAGEWSAASLCAEIIDQEGTPIEVDQFVNGGWLSHICGLPFNDFPVVPGEGYFVKSTEASTVLMENPLAMGDVFARPVPRYRRWIQPTTRRNHR